MPQKKNTGFTLVEVLTSIVIIALVAIASYTGFYVLSGGNEVSRNRLQAISVSQAALEEIRGVARSDFTGLATHYAAHINQTTQTPGFLRTINIVPVPGTANLQKAEVTINWQDKGQPRSYNTAILISQPPEPLPANIYGDVTDATTASQIVGARVHLTHVTTNHTADFYTATNLNCPLHPLHNPRSYHFCDAVGNFKLEAGDWNLQVRCEAPTCTAYYNSTVIPVFPPSLASNEDRQVDIQLQPRPVSGNIIGRFVVVATSNPITGLAVNLSKGGTVINNTTTNATGFRFSDIAFPDSNPQNFTVYTWNATYTKRYCGHFWGPTGTGISPQTPTKPFNYHGWSSSPDKEDGSVISCSNPWRGDVSRDRICINPGETKNLGDIELSPVPLATLKGYVKDTFWNPVSNATINVWWHGGTIAWGSTNTDSSGNYGSGGSFSVPAEQELFPSSSSYYMRVRAEATVSRICCCNVTCSQTVTSTATAGPAYQGSTLTTNFILPASGTNQQCGNADGYLKDGQAGTNLAGVTVTISGSRTTDGSGYYTFKCGTAGPHSIPTGSYSVTASRSGYYTFQSGGNWVYSNRGPISITYSHKTTYETIRLWPAGYGTIQGQVLHQGTTNPIIGATVQLDYYSDGGGTSFDRNATTDANGRFVFNTAVETWPAPAVVGHSYYNQTARQHNLKFTHPDYYDVSPSNQYLDAGGTLNLNVEMTPKSGI